MTTDQIEDLKQEVRRLQIGVSILPLGSVTPEMVAKVRELNELLAAEACPPRVVRTTTHKPTTQEVYEHQLRTGQLFGSCSAGIHPTFAPYYLRRVKG